MAGWLQVRPLQLCRRLQPRCVHKVDVDDVDRWNMRAAAPENGDPVTDGLHQGTARITIGEDCTDNEYDKNRGAIWGKRACEGEGRLQVGELGRVGTSSAELSEMPKVGVKGKSNTATDFFGDGAPLPNGASHRNQTTTSRSMTEAGAATSAHPRTKSASHLEGRTPPWADVAPDRREEVVVEAGA